MPTDLLLFGIRHHGPGSAASLLAALDDYQPDLLLLECPADAEDALALATHPEMVPPVALLVYSPRQQAQATFLPFAEFSPEWQALHWAKRHGTHVRCFDLPMSLRFGLGVVVGQPDLHDILHPAAAPAAPAAEPIGDTELDHMLRAVKELEQQMGLSGGGPPAGDQAGEAGGSNKAPEVAAADPVTDPVAYLAGLAGYTDPEQWWETHLEHTPCHTGTFAAVLELMTMLREGLSQPETEETLLREAYMRQTLRASLTQGYQRVAVVCGAWHTPVLRPEWPAAPDAALLKPLKKEATQSTWIPWTHERLATSSGYGAGIVSPAWYELLFTEPRDQVLTQWMVRAARLLRGQDLPGSVAHAIEGVRLAHTLAAMRGMALPGIAELREAAVAILGGGYDEPLHLVHEELVIGYKLGAVPPDVPTTPFQQDLARQQKSLRLKPEAEAKPLALDLRQVLHLQRSHFLHRLLLLDIRWAQPAQSRVNSQGTFHEDWLLRWQPELALAVIEAGRWGNTVAEAATHHAAARALHSASLADLSELLDQVLRADLAPAVALLVAQLEKVGADTYDVTHLLAALPPLVQVLRYGNVRRTNATQVAQVLSQLVPRLCIGLPAACASLSYEAAKPLLDQLEAAHQAVRLLQDAAHETDWYAALTQVQQSAATSGLLAGAATRLLFDARQLAPADAASALGLALGAAQPAEYAAAWLEGFLRGSGLLLIHHRELFDLLHHWLDGLSEDIFCAVVPLLRRTFTEFAGTERRQLFDRARIVVLPPSPVEAAPAAADAIDWSRGMQALPGLWDLLGTPPE